MLFSRQFLSFILIALVFIVFGRSLGFEHINYDDRVYISSNPHLWDGIDWNDFIWAFKSNLGGNWNPVLWISFFLDTALFGTHTAGYHYINLFLHLANVLLIFYWLDTVTKRLGCSFVVALLFAVHPMHVEAVVWITSRKDVLSTFFFLLMLFFYYAYSRYDLPNHDEGNKHKKWKWLILWYLFFVLGLWTKPALVTVPFLLFLVDIWPLNRIDIKHWKSQHKRLVWLFVEKVPAFLLIAFSSYMTIWAHSKSQSILEPKPIETVISSIFNHYVFYLEKTFWPFDLTVVYPRLVYSISGSWDEILLMLLLSLGALMSIKRFPVIFVGWFWFVGVLFPLSGIVEFGMHPVADRFSYIPHIGLFILLVFGSTQLLKPYVYRWRSFYAPLTTIVIGVVLSILCFKQVGYWKNTEVLFEHATHCNPNFAFNHVMYAKGALENEKYEISIEEFKKALELDGENPNTQITVYSHIALNYRLLKEFELSLEYANKALDVIRSQEKRDQAVDGKRFAYTQIAMTELELKHYPKVEIYLDKMAEIEELAAWELAVYGEVKCNKKEFDVAINYFKQALDLRPKSKPVAKLLVQLKKEYAEPFGKPLNELSDEELQQFCKFTFHVEEEEKNKN